MLLHRSEYRDLHILLDMNVLPDRHTFYKTEIGVA